MVLSLNFIKQKCQHPLEGLHLKLLSYVNARNKDEEDTKIRVKNPETKWANNYTSRKYKMLSSQANKNDSQVICFWL
jgi:hypothetical protein